MSSKAKDIAINGGVAVVGVGSVSVGVGMLSPPWGLIVFGVLVLAALVWGILR